MRRVSDFLENARACRELARRMPSDQRETLLRMAEQWELIATERRRELARSGDDE
jgi:hypothetical protein